MFLCLSGGRRRRRTLPTALVHWGEGVGGRVLDGERWMGGGVGGMDGGEGGNLVILDGGKRWRVRGEVIYGMAEELGTA